MCGRFMHSAVGGAGRWGASVRRTWGEEGREDKHQDMDGVKLEGAQEEQILGRDEVRSMPKIRKCIRAVRMYV